MSADTSPEVKSAAFILSHRLVPILNPNPGTPGHGIHAVGLSKRGASNEDSHVDTSSRKRHSSESFRRPAIATREEGTPHPTFPQSHSVALRRHSVANTVVPRAKSWASPPAALRTSPDPRPRTSSSPKKLPGHQNDIKASELWNYLRPSGLERFGPALLAIGLADTSMVQWAVTSGWSATVVQISQFSDSLEILPLVALRLQAELSAFAGTKLSLRAGSYWHHAPAPAAAYPSGIVTGARIIDLEAHLEASGLARFASTLVILGAVDLSMLGWIVSVGWKATVEQIREATVLEGGDEVCPVLVAMRLRGELAAFAMSSFATAAHWQNC